MIDKKNDKPGFDKQSFSEQVERRAQHYVRRVKKQRAAYHDLVRVVAANHYLADTIADQLLSFYDMAKNIYNPKTKKNGITPFFTHKKLASMRHSEHRNTSREIIKKLFIDGVLKPVTVKFEDDTEWAIWRKRLADGEIIMPGFDSNRQYTPYTISWKRVDEYLKTGYKPASDPMKPIKPDDLYSGLTRQMERMGARREIEAIREEYEQMQREIVQKAYYEFELKNRMPKGNEFKYEQWISKRSNYTNPFKKAHTEAFMAKNQQRIDELKALS